MWAGGSVTALAASPGFVHSGTLFAATLAGLHRSNDAGQTWERTGEGPSALLLSDVVTSPKFPQDAVILVASLEGGIFRSADGGRTWTPVEIEGQQVHISALAISPNFPRDGTAFAGTMADGVLCTRDWGATWQASNFGLLDLNVLDVAISPTFDQDEIVFAATTVGVFRSPNGGRAWRETAFPLEAAPVQCLVSASYPAPNSKTSFAEEGILFAGTEAAGVFRSSDGGQHWQALGGALAGECVNALALSPAFVADQTVLAATDAALYVSRDAGEHWSRCATLPGVLCLLLAPSFPRDGLALAGCSQTGVYRSTSDLTSWQPANVGLAGRLLTGMVLAPEFELAFGSGEGVIRSNDAGRTWRDISAGLPSRQVNDLIVVSTVDEANDLYTALPEGIWRCPSQSATWELVSELPAQRLAPSPAFAKDGVLLAGIKAQGLWLSSDRGRNWQPIDGPWTEREVLALALSSAFPQDKQAFVATMHPIDGGVTVWCGEIGGAWEPIIHHRAPALTATLVVPTAYPRDNRWYAAIDDQFYRPLPGAVEVRHGKQRPAFVSCTLARERPRIMDLALLPAPPPGEWLAATSQGMYASINGGADWHRVENGLPRRSIMAVASLPNHKRGPTVYALELGGSFWRLIRPVQSGD